MWLCEKVAFQLGASYAIRFLDVLRVFKLYVLRKLRITQDQVLRHIGAGTRPRPKLTA